MSTPQEITRPTGKTNLSEDEIRTRAYELYQQRGHEEGNDAEDWLRAEQEISHKAKNRKAA